MADETGAPVPTGASPFDVPGDLKELADHFGAPKYVSTRSELPLSGNWAGRELLVIETNEWYTWNAGWYAQSRMTDGFTEGVLAGGWDTPSHNTISRRGGWVELRFNARRSTNLAVGGVLVTVPSGFRADAPAWGFAWGLLGANSTIQCYYDTNTNQVRVQQAVSATQAIALSMRWLAA